MASTTSLRTRPDAPIPSGIAPQPRLPFDALVATDTLLGRLPTLGWEGGLPVLASFVALAALVVSRPEAVKVDDAVNAALRMVDETALITSTTVRYSGLWVKFGRYCRQRGVVTIDEVTPEVVGDWIAALTSKGTNPAVSTKRLRRTAITKLYELLRPLGITKDDPARDVRLDRRPTVVYRGLTPSEIDCGRETSLATLVETRQPAIWALAEAGATPSEIASATGADVDLVAGTVWLEGLDAAVPRHAHLSEWGRQQLARRMSGVEAVDVSLTYSGAGPIETAQISVSVALGKILNRAGLGGLEGVGPRSLRIAYGLDAYAARQRIDDAAIALGMRSLDQTASLLGIVWELGEA